MAIPDGLIYRPLRSDEVEEHDQLLRQSFRPSLKREAVRASDFFVLADENKLCATLAAGIQRQMFGGRAVPSLLLTAVTTEPRCRGAGLGRRIVFEAMSDARRNGAAVTVLFPNATRLYHKLGFGFAGDRFTYAAPTECFEGPKKLPTRPMVAGDHDRVVALFESIVVGQSGPILRTVPQWEALLSGCHGFVVGQDQIEGYVLIDKAQGRDLRLLDVCLSTPAAVAAAIALIVELAVNRESVVWFGGRKDLLRARLGCSAVSERSGPSVFSHWMLRILDVGKALSARGYAAHEQRLAVEITDALFGDQDGTYELVVANGVGHVTTGASSSVPLLKATPEGLGPLYTGYVSPWALETAGLIEGDDRALRAAAQIFAGPSPWMPDHI